MMKKVDFFKKNKLVLIFCLLFCCLFAFVLETMMVLDDAIYINKIYNEETIFTEDIDIITYKYQQDGQKYVQLDADPHIYIRNINKNIETVEIQFLDYCTNISAMRLYYPNENNLLDEVHAVNFEYYENELRAIAEIPIDNYEYLRFDIDADFVLDDITISSQPVAKKINWEATLQNYNLLIFLELFASFCIPVVFLCLSSIALLSRKPEFESSLANVQTKVKIIVYDMIPVIILLFVFYFMLFIYEPILMYATNMDEFWFDFSIMIVYVIKIFALFLLLSISLMVIVYFLNSLFSKEKKLFKFLLLCGYVTFFLSYIQGNWLLGNLPILDGRKIDWEIANSFENLVLLVCFILVVALICYSILKFKFDKTVKYMAAGSVLIGVMLMISLISTVFINGAFRSKDNFSATCDNFNTI